MEELIKALEAHGMAFVEFIMDYPDRVLFTATVDERPALVTYNKEDHWVLSKGEAQMFWDVEFKLEGIVIN
ncbi:hypothetical protein HV436_01330 [Bacillus sporothermodurans]|uniref:hypothetical protein n=1 Tax=Heyndrickxia sporothermodurans TaxID=46224 RepID=UPI00192B112E|nr:hypothetical protein [Heyndrickxia sporothermodurans]MBL5776978.1 hypothetical protein [Heyndrickxia sporothermodurans]MBL5798505.1 hypothetical protein [Heyndrickxia sporothermodurans]MBL5809422.1 hypothetical protein [Heyndrickxia sporothermodurans]MBL5813057.1 hypothetical protein [Heyndrickxia sporothermodurans]MBL5816481.1 hypothetical protein [Heyndrickxia sporothermodurans]